VASSISSARWPRTLDVTMEMETCPKCGAHFPASEAWAYRSALVSVVAPGWQDLDTRVRCPGCGHIFPAAAIRYLGFLSPTAMKVLVRSIMVAIILAVIYGLFLDAALR